MWPLAILQSCCRHEIRTSQCLLFRAGIFGARNFREGLLYSPAWLLTSDFGPHGL
jgi:hypothetical protein